MQTLLRQLVSIGLFRVGIHDEGQHAGEVVHHRQLLGEHQQDVRRADCVGFVDFGQARLDIAYRVIAEIARQPAAEARQAGQRGDLEARLVFADEIQRIVDFVRGFSYLSCVSVTCLPRTVMRVSAGRPMKE